MAERCIFQDGADFYAETADTEETTHLWTAPFKVLDHDTEAAERARAEFLTWCAMSDIQPVFGA